MFNKECTECPLGPCKKNEKKCEGLEDDLAELTGSTRDWYPDSVSNADGTVSIEEAAKSEHKLKEFFDNQIEQENKGIVGTQIKGERPCVRQKHSTS